MLASQIVTRTFTSSPQPWMEFPYGSIGCGKMLRKRSDSTPPRTRRVGGVGMGGNRRGGDRMRGWSRPISRVLSWTAIPLGRASPRASSGLPGCSAGHTCAPLFGLAPGGVYRAAACYHPRGALLPHPFTLTCALAGHRRSALCGTFRRLAPPRHYLAPCPVEPGLSSTARGRSGCLADSMGQCTVDPHRSKDRAQRPGAPP